MFGRVPVSGLTDVASSGDCLNSVIMFSTSVASPESRSNSTSRPSRTWLTAIMYIAAVALFLRFYNLPLKPLHSDEAVNGLFLTRLVVPPHQFHYDPANYHGPTLFYAAWLSTLVFAAPTVAIRSVAGVAALLSMGLILRLRRSIGSIGTLAAASLLAVSPGAVYFSRYFIHEMLLVCFTIGLVTAAVDWRHSRREASLYLAALSAGLMFATKETAFISVFVLAAAMFGAAWLVEARSQARAGHPVDPPWKQVFLRRALHDVLDPHNRGRRQLVSWLIAAGIVLGVNVLFFTSFFTHPEGALDAIKAVSLWTRTGTSEHVHPSYTYLAWLTQQEMPVLVLGTAGAVLALRKADNQFAVFAALWSIGILAAYSVIPYKTPWLTLNMIAPLAICGGYTADVVWRHLAATRRGVVAGVAATAVLSFSTYQAVALSFVRYDDNSNPYVYAHTSRDVLALVTEVQRLGEHNRDMTITVTSRSQFPLSWYLRSYRSRYYNTPLLTNDSLVIGGADQQLALDSLLGDRYAKVGRYLLRPGVGLILYGRRDLAGLGSSDSKPNAPDK